MPHFAITDQCNLHNWSYYREMSMQPFTCLGVIRDFFAKRHSKAKVQKLVDLRYKCSKITMIALFRHPAA